MNAAGIAAQAGIAGDKFQAENREDVEDQYRKASLANNLQLQNAQVSLIPNATAAAAAQYGLQGTTAAAQTPVAAASGAADLTQQQNRGAVAQHQTSQLPVMFGAQDAELGTHANAMKNALGKSNLDVEQMPDLINKARVANAIDQTHVGLYMQGGLAQALLSGDPQVAVNYLNKMSTLKGADGQPIAPVLGGKEFSSVTPVQSADATGKQVTSAFTFAPKDGSQPYTVPAAQLYQAYRMMNPAELVKLTANEKLVQRDSLGNVTEVGDNEIEKYRHNTVNGQIYSQKTGKVLPGGSEAWNPYQEKHDAHVDAQVNKAREMLDSEMKGFMAEMNPNRASEYNFRAATAGAMIRKGMPFEQASAEAKREWQRQSNTDAATPEAGAASAPDFSNLFKKQ